MSGVDQRPPGPGRRAGDGRRCRAPCPGGSGGGAVGAGLGLPRAGRSKAERDGLMIEMLDEVGLNEAQGVADVLQRYPHEFSGGQRQRIAIARAVVLRPEILVLDEATANIDTVTEQLLEQILRELPASTTKVVIAHRLNTIENADEIFFINGGEITPAGSMDHALDLLLHGKRAS